MAVIEGHAEHVMDAVAPGPAARRCPSCAPRWTAAAGRSRACRGWWRKLLGLDLKLRQYEQGKYFCDAIVRARGTEALRHVFSSPEALPTAQELKDPDAWVARAMPREVGPAQRESA